MSGSRTHWKKPPTRVYDYNYNLGEHYYKPQLRHADLRQHGRAGSPPKAKTFAERFAEDPVYGSYGAPTWSRARKSSLTDDLFGRPNRSTAGDRFAPHSERSGPGFSEDAEFGRPRFNPSDEFGEFGKPRFSFGERLLDAAGAGGCGRSPRPGGTGRGNETHSPRVMDDPFDEPFFSRGKRLGREGNLTADSDFMTEDPFKAKARRAFDGASADELMDDMKRDSESAASRFRSKLRAKRAQEDSSDFGSGFDDANMDNSTESRIEKIRQRAKARIAEAMEDDFGSSGKAFSGDDSFAGFRTPGTKGVGFADDFDSVGGGAGSKSVRISKRSVKTYDAD